MLDLIECGVALCHWCAKQSLGRVALGLVKVPATTTDTRHIETIAGRWAFAASIRARWDMGLVSDFP